MAQESKWITGNEVIFEVLGYRMWEVDEDVSRNALKECGFDLSEAYKEWGKEHARMIMAVLYAKLNSMEKQLRKPYLISIKCNTDALLDRSLIEEVGQLIAMVVSVLAAIISIMGKAEENVSLLLFMLFIFVAIYWFMTFIRSKYSYRDSFYEKIIAEMLKDISEEIR